MTRPQHVWPDPARPLTRNGCCYVRGCTSPVGRLRVTTSGVYVMYCSPHHATAVRLFGDGGERPKEGKP